MKIAHKTDIGKIRQVNEDRCAIVPNLNGYTLAIVADGMGGHQAGDTASQLTIEMIQQELSSSIHTGMSDQECLDALEAAIRKANEVVFDAASRKEHYHGMGTTVVAALVDGQRIRLGHIGDSRAYLIDNGRLRQLTEDHTLVNELVKNGQITPDEAASHPRRNVLTRALGTEQHSEVDLTVLDWHSDQQLLLCSDGLNSIVPESAMATVLGSEAPAEDKVSQLVNLALDAGGDDNITVVLLHNIAEPDEDSDRDTKTSDEQKAG